MNERYPYLPKGRIIKYVSSDNVFMREAQNVRDNHSTDMFFPTGAVVVKDNTIIGKGANRSALKNERLMELHRKGLCMRKILKIPSGKAYWICPGCASPRQHAEGRAVRDALQHKKDINGADLYLYGHWWCCKICWDAMIDAGIKDVYLLEGADLLWKR